jgi:hypothetical protein
MPHPTFDGPQDFFILDLRIFLSDWKADFATSAVSGHNEAVQSGIHVMRA